MTDQRQPAPHPLASTLALLEREMARRAKGTPAGTMRLADDELRAMLELLRREVGPATSSENTSDGCEIGGGREVPR